MKIGLFLGDGVTSISMEPFRISNTLRKLVLCGVELRNSTKRAACNHRVMDAIGRLLSTKEAQEFTECNFSFLPGSA